jgi:DNA polymerase-1
VQNCTLCSLYKSGGKVVEGEGPLPAKLMFIGQQPDRTERKTGRPYSGRAGIRLTAFMQMAGVVREQVRVTDLVRHYVPVKHHLLVGEWRVCGDAWLKDEIEATSPEVIITLGDKPAKYLNKTTKLSLDHGRSRLIEWEGRTIIHVPMYEPASTLYDTRLLADMIEDFKRLGSEIAKGHNEDTTYEIGTKPPDLDLLVAGTVGFDLETTSPSYPNGKFNVRAAEIIGWSMSEEAGQGIYVPDNALSAKELLEDDRIEKVCHNTKFEYARLKAVGINLTSYHDTKLAAFLLGYYPTHLKVLTRQILGHDPITYDQITEGVSDMSEMQPIDILPYAVADSDNTLQLWTILEPELHHWNLWGLYSNVELPLIQVLAGMEEAGIGVNDEKLEALRVDIQLEQEHVAALLHAEMGEDFNLNSTPDLAHWLEKMGAPISERTETKGDLKTDKTTLFNIRDWNPNLIDNLLQSGAVDKMMSYVTGYKALQHPDGLLHPQWNQVGHYEEASDKSPEAPATGRLSASLPNMTNVPNKGLRDATWAMRLRDCIEAPEGYTLISADLAQEEPRVTAHVTQCSRLLEDFEAGVPIYGPIGSIAYGFEVGKHTHPYHWDKAKKMYLCLCYGGAWPKFLEIEPRLGKSGAQRAEAMFKERYFELVGYYEATRVLLIEQGYVRDMCDRIRWLPGIYSDDQAQKEAAVREAVNHLTGQGPAATVMKRLLVRVAGLLPSGAEIVLAIHDDVVVRCLLKDARRVIDILAHMTEGIMPFELPVELKEGRIWGQMKDVVLG